jgi:AraC-like DNA-binding protein
MNRLGKILPCFLNEKGREAKKTLPKLNGTRLISSNPNGKKTRLRTVLSDCASKGKCMHSRLDWINDWEDRFRRCRYKASVVAKACGVTLRFLETYFRFRFEITPHQWILKTRMYDAERLLIQGTAVKAIAIDLGYNAPGNFCRDFKLFYGATPRCYLFGQGRAL